LIRVIDQAVLDAIKILDCEIVRHVMNNNEQLEAVSKKFFSTFNGSERVVAVDVETTGVNIKIDRVVQFAAVILQRGVKPQAIQSYINPGFSIPAEATAVHGITDDDVKDAPTFSSVAESIKNILSDAIIIGYNGNRYDIPLLDEEFRRSGVEFDIKSLESIDPYLIFVKNEPRDLSAAYKRFVGTELTGAHDAMVDTIATIQILTGQADEYESVPNTISELVESQKPEEKPADKNSLPRGFVWRDEYACLSFGKKAGKSLQWMVQNELGYLMWMLKQDFPEETKEILRNAIDHRKFPTKE